MTRTLRIVMGMVVLALASFVALPASAAPVAPAAILAKVYDIQELPSVASLVGKAGSVFASKLGLGKLNQATKEDVYSFCTCPSEKDTSILPKPNGGNNVNPICNTQYYDKPTKPFAEVVIGAVMTQVNKMLSGISKKFYEGLVNSGQITTILGAALVLYFVIYGIMVATGMMAIDAGDSFNRIIKISILMGLLSPTGWNLFTTYFGNIFLNGTLELANMFSQISQTGSASNSAAMSDFQGAVSFLNRPLNIIFSMKFFVMMAALPTVGPFGFVVAIILVVCILMFIWLVVSALITFLKALVGIYIMLGLAPIFISMFLFRRTREMFMGWINQLITFFLQPILVFAFLGFFTTLFTNNLKAIVDKTEYCFVPFMQLFGDYVQLSWFRPAVIYDEQSFKSNQYSSVVQQAEKWKSDNNLDDAGIVQLVQNKQDARDRDTIITLAESGRLQQSTIDFLKSQNYFGVVQTVDSTGKLVTVPRDVQTTSGAASTAGEYLYAYKGSWDFHGPDLPNAYATGRWEEVKTGKANDFPVNPNDVMLFMLLTFLGWRYCGLIGKLAEQMAGGVSDATSADDTSKWFMSKLGGRNVVDETLKKASGFKNTMAPNLLALLATRNMAKAQETYRPDLVDPKNAMNKKTAASTANESAGGGAGGGSEGGNPDMTGNRGNPTDAAVMQAGRKVDENINDDAYYASVKSRANQVKDELQKDAALTELSGEEGTFGDALKSRFGKTSALTKEQRDLIKMIDNEATSREKLEKILSMQKLRQGRKIEDYVRQSDSLGMDKALSKDKMNDALRKTAGDLLNDELIIQRLSKKLQST